MAWPVAEIVSAIAFAIISTPFVAILIGPEQLGKSALAWGIMSVLEVICCAGVQTALIRSPSIHTLLTDTANTAVVGITLTIMIGLMAAAAPLSRLLGDSDLYALLVTGSVAIPLSGASVVPIAILTRKLRVKKLTISSILARAVTLIVTLTLAALGYGALSIVVGVVGGNATALLVVLMATTRLPSLRFDWQEFKPLMALSASAATETLLGTSAIRIFAVLVGFLSGPLALGHFQLGMRLVDEVATLFQSLIARYSLAYLAAFSRQKRDARGILMNGTRILAYASMPAFAGLAICANDLVLTIFGRAWEPSAPILALCSIGWLLAFPVQLLFSQFKATGHQNTVTLYALFSSVTAFTLLFALSGFGEWAIGFAWAARHIAAVPFAVIGAGLVYRMRGRRIARNLFKPAFATTLMLLIIYFAVVGRSISPPFRLMLEIIVGVVSYVSVIWLIDRRFILRSIDRLHLSGRA